MEKSEEVKTEVAKAPVGKVSRQKVADQLGVFQSIISSLYKRDVKAMIEQETIGFLGSVPQAIDNISRLINEMPNIGSFETEPCFPSFFFIGLSVFFG
jgi:hypothetical protein